MTSMRYRRCTESGNHSPTGAAGRIPLRPGPPASTAMISGWPESLVSPKTISVVASLADGLLSTGTVNTKQSKPADGQAYGRVESDFLGTWDIAPMETIANPTTKATMRRTERPRSIARADETVDGSWLLVTLVGSLPTRRTLWACLRAPFVYIRACRRCRARQRPSRVRPRRADRILPARLAPARRRGAGRRPTIGRRECQCRPRSDIVTQGSNRP